MAGRDIHVTHIRRVNSMKCIEYVTHNILPLSMAWFFTCYAQLPPQAERTHYELRLSHQRQRYPCNFSTN